VKQLTRSFRFVFPAALAALALLTLEGVAGAQDTNSDSHNVTITVSEVALIDIEGAAAPGFVVDGAGVVAGASPLTGTTSQDTGNRYLQYTSIVSGTQLRNIVVKRDANLPAFLDLNLLLATAVGTTNDEGTTGSRATETRVLSTSDQTAITGIGSGYTGTGATDGWKFNYSLTFKDPTLSTNVGLIRAAALVTVVVTYTITAGA
jgi:hypothetical protein